MSKALERALETMQNKTSVKRVGYNRIEVTDAPVFWDDFDGTKSQYNKEVGKKGHFCLALTQEMVEWIKEYVQSKGGDARIHYKDVYSEQDVAEKGVEQVTLAYIDVKVNMFSQNPPMVKILSVYNGKRQPTQILNGEDIARLAKCSGSIESYGITFRMFVNPESIDKDSKKPRCTFYATNITAMQEPQYSPYNGKYDDFDDQDEQTVSINDVNTNGSDGESC